MEVVNWHGIRKEEVNDKGPEGRRQEKRMSYYRYDTRDDDFETRFRRAVRGREGFAWGAFLIGFILGGIIF